MGPFVIKEFKQDSAIVIEVATSKEKRFHINRLMFGTLPQQFIASPQAHEPYPAHCQRNPHRRINPFFDPSVKEDNDLNPRWVPVAAPPPPPVAALPPPPAGRIPPSPPGPPVPPRPSPGPSDTPKRHTRSDGPVDTLPNVMDRPIEFRHRPHSSQDS